MSPKKPARISEFAQAVLQALSDARLGDRISIGGAFGLLHFVDHRDTHDIDAWWESSVTAKDREAVLATVETAMARFGDVDRRAWGDVTSVDLKQEGRTVFNFQVAERSARIEPSVQSPWVAVKLDSLSDLVASKMVALVERGAPRDFLDIHEICRVRAVTSIECWNLWKKRQGLAGSGADFHRARLAIETHLQRIEQHRPLEKIESKERRKSAAQVRLWFREDFLNVIPN